jgi:hypothetical protein
MGKNKILFVKPPDRFLEDEFVYQQLGPHYLQSFLERYEILSDILVLYEQSEVRNKREAGTTKELTLEQLNMLFLGADGKSQDKLFDNSILQDYDIVALSVMSPQASDAYLISQLINKLFPHITTVIGGSHPRYYQTQVESLPESKAFDFIVPQDGWAPIYKIATGQIQKTKKSVVLIDNSLKLTELPAPFSSSSSDGSLQFRYCRRSGISYYHSFRMPFFLQFL